VPPNTTALLRGFVTSALKDPTNVTWSTADVDNLVIRAVRSLSPRVQLPLSPQSYTQALTKGTYFYALNAAIVSLSRVDLVDTNSDERGPLAIGTWEIAGDLNGGTAKIHIAPSVVDGIGGTLRYNGYGRYDLSANLIPDDYLAYVVAHATAAGFTWLRSDRVRFKQYLDADQTTNTSVNELGQMLNDAQRDVERERSRLFTMRKPMPGRF